MKQLLLINILSRVPSDLNTLFERFVKGKTIAKGGLATIIIAAIIPVSYTHLWDRKLILMA